MIREVLWTILVMLAWYLSMELIYRRQRRKNNRDAWLERLEWTAIRHDMDKFDA